MRIDPTISLGTIIAFAGILVTIIAMHTANRERLTRIETKVDAMWRAGRFILRGGPHQSDERERGRD